MKPTLAIALSSALGVIVGSGGYALVDSAPYTPTHIPASAPAARLSEAAAARFIPLTPEHVREVDVVLRGVQSAEDPAVWFPQTRARISVPATVAGRAPYTYEHASLTNSAAMPGIIGLIEQVLMPLARAQCPDLADADAYEPKTAHVEYAGVEGTQARMRMVVPSKIEGLPPLPCNVRGPAPPDALAAVTQMVNGFVVPAVKDETGLR